MVFVPVVAVGAVGTPVKAGLSLMFCTNAVVAICVVFVPVVAVGAVGTPVKSGDILAACT